MMITITPAAAQQIKTSAQQNHMEGMPLRIAAMRNADGSVHYGLGFDDTKDKDLTYNSEGVTLIIAPNSIDLLSNTVIDYVKLDNGEMNFIFKNPNDPNYHPAQ